jgi:hypothetical protein
MGTTAAPSASEVMSAVDGVHLIGGDAPQDVGANLAGCVARQRGTI